MESNTTPTEKISSEEINVWRKGDTHKDVALTLLESGEVISRGEKKDFRERYNNTQNIDIHLDYKRILDNEISDDEKREYVHEGLLNINKQIPLFENQSSLENDQRYPTSYEINMGSELYKTIYAKDISHNGYSKSDFDSFVTGRNHLRNGLYQVIGQVDKGDYQEAAYILSGIQSRGTYKTTLMKTEDLIKSTGLKKVPREIVDTSILTLRIKINYMEYIYNLIKKGRFTSIEEALEEYYSKLEKSKSLLHGIFSSLDKDKVINFEKRFIQSNKSEEKFFKRDEEKQDKNAFILHKRNTFSLLDKTLPVLFQKIQEIKSY